VPTVSDFLDILAIAGSSILYNRQAEDNPCPCRTPEGYRDPIWHLQHPNSAMCNEAGFLPSPNDVNLTVKAIFTPIQSTRATRLRSQYILADFGEIETGDHLGIFPGSWAGVTLNFYDWGTSGDDYLEHDGRRFMVIHSNAIPDPDGGDFHHWEVGCRLISSEAL
jgi:hypothetical protein